MATVRSRIWTSRPRVSSGCVSFFASDSNDLGASFKEIVLNVDDWNAFVVADRGMFEKHADKPTDAAVLDVM